MRGYSESGAVVQQVGPKLCETPPPSPRHPIRWARSVGLHAWGKCVLGFQVHDFSPTYGPGRCEGPVGRAEMGLHLELPAMHGSQSCGAQVRVDGWEVSMLCSSALPGQVGKETLSHRYQEKRCFSMC